MGADGLVVAETATLAELQEGWTRLALASGDLFASWEWARAWEDVHGADGRVLLTFRRTSGELVGIARLSRERRGPLRWWTFEGQGATDQVGPICAPADRAQVAAALRRMIGNGRGQRAALLAAGLMQDEGWTDLLGGVRLQERPSPVLELSGLDWTSWLATKSANFRQQTQRRERKLIRDHGLTFRRIEEPGDLAETWSELLRFHEERWQGESDFFAAGGDRLHRVFAELGLRRGWLRLHAADLEGRPAAYWLGYHYAGAYWFFQLARDPRWSQTSIGTVLLGHTVRSAIDEGAQRYRFLSGRQDYKQRFADADAGHDQVLVAGPALTRLAVLGLEVSHRLPPTVRSRVRTVISSIRR